MQSADNVFSVEARLTEDCFYSRPVASVLRLSASCSVASCSGKAQSLGTRTRRALTHVENAACGCGPLPLIHKQEIGRRSSKEETLAGTPLCRVYPTTLL